MTPVRLIPAALRSQVKYSTTEPLHSREQKEKSVPNFRTFTVNRILLIFVTINILIKDHIFMSPNRRGGVHIDFGADPVGVGVSVGVSMTLS